MAGPKIPDDIKQMNFEDALEELQRIVDQLETGKGKLDEAISAYERGAALKQHCEAKLTEARHKVEQIKLDAHGAVSAVPLDGLTE